MYFLLIAVYISYICTGVCACVCACVHMCVSCFVREKCYVHCAYSPDMLTGMMNLLSSAMIKCKTSMFTCVKCTLCKYTIILSIRPDDAGNDLGVNSRQDLN